MLELLFIGLMLIAAWGLFLVVLVVTLVIMHYNGIQIEDAKNELIRIFKNLVIIAIATTIITTMASVGGTLVMLAFYLADPFLWAMVLGTVIVIILGTMELLKLIVVGELEFND